ncbi:hypothetical protein PENSUB_10311 [Penicillium subrubescens]|uniref:Uncharacterized protein n=1 Tax=Penicillium subrubescens TaxID=1316194 RepID=A0A1Q5TBC7_9EURO|nr:hypothetical protein PENSUB_10311 [Penicillium subrubescens]
MGGSTEIVELFIAAHARLNDHYTKPPGSILGVAIEMGDMASIHILLTAGARLIGAKIRKIGNLEIAQSLLYREMEFCEICYMFLGARFWSPLLPMANSSKPSICLIMMPIMETSAGE